MQRRRATGAGAGARGCGPHHHPVSQKIPARDESSFGCVVQIRQFFVRFLFEVCWLLSFFSAEVPVQVELVRVRASVPEGLTPPWRVSLGVVLVWVCPRGHLSRTIRGRFLGLRLLF